jgi:hypothetical protein
MTIRVATLPRTAEINARGREDSREVSSRFFEPSWFGASRTWPAFAFSRLGLRAP